MSIWRQGQPRQKSICWKCEVFGVSAWDMVRRRSGCGGGAMLLVLGGAVCAWWSLGGCEWV